MPGNSRGFTGDSGEKIDKRVLVVDDDPDIRRLVEMALRSVCLVETAENGSQALARCSRPPPVDLVLCDIMMPQLNGFEFLNRVRMLPQGKYLPVAFLTAVGTPRNVIAGIQLGARHFINKPFRVDDLVKKVQKLLRG
jgi:CheY-like chemotaxis protein